MSDTDDMFDEPAEERAAAPVALDSPMDFDDLAPVVVPVKYQGKQYVLHEASEGAFTAWRKSQTHGATLGADGKSMSLGDGLADSEPLLVSLCLFEVYQGPRGDERERPVALQVLRGWPARLVTQIYRRLFAISDLERDDSADDIRRKIVALQKKLATLEAGRGNGRTPSTTATSG